MHSPPLQDHLDADAVCAQCGTVNPEGTLICKTCGNNLRDQRHLRLQAEQILEGESPSEWRRYTLSGLLTAFGVLIALYAAINADSITEWLVAGGGAQSASFAGYWTGANADVYDALSQQIEGLNPTAAQVEATVAEPVVGASVAGVYIIVVHDGLLGARPVGLAAGQEEGEQLYYVARLGAREVRGRATYYGQSIASQWNDAAIDMDGDYRGVSGVVMPQGPGVFECFGQTDVSSAEYTAMAYRFM